MTLGSGLGISVVGGCGMTEVGVGPRVEGIVVSKGGVAEGAGSSAGLAKGRLQARAASRTKVVNSKPRGFIGNPPVGLSRSGCVEGSA